MFIIINQIQRQYIAAGGNKMHDNIIIRDIKNIDQRLEMLKNNSYEYNWDNYIIHYFFRRRKILVKIKRGVIYAVVPYSSECRRFVGRFYEDNDMLCMEGKFELLNHVKILYGISLGIAGLMWSLIFSLIIAGKIVFIEELLWFLLGTFAMIFFGIWYLFQYRSKKYEQEIVNYITDILMN